jgi:hypothetical protein
VATVSQSITFCLYTSDGSCLSSSHSTSFNNLVAGTPLTSNNTLNVSFDTNADSGGSIYIYSNGKLQSTTNVSGTINSVAGLLPVDLSSQQSGYGAQVSSTNLTAQSPYNGSGTNVGGLFTTITKILTTAGPIVGGTAAINLQAKASNTTPGLNDYADTVTVIAAATF